MRGYYGRNGESTPVLEVEGLTKRYGQITTVNNVALRVYPGEIVGLLGANGAGKTTSFHMICGLIQASAGVIYLDGKDVTHWPMHRRCKGGLGYLPQDRSTFGALTVEQNLYGAMEYLGYAKRDRRKLCDELLERFELTAYRKRVVGYGGSGGLSGGERRRLEVARALISRPKILMLDEPFAACDPETISKIQRAVQEIAADGLAVLINDHAIANTLKITRRAYVINKGSVLCEGNAMETLCNPAAIHYYFGHEARDNAETIGKAQGYSPEEARAMVAEAYEEVERRWPSDLEDARERKEPRAESERGSADRRVRDFAGAAPPRKTLELRRRRRDDSLETPRATRETVEPPPRVDKRDAETQNRRKLSLTRRNDEEPRRAPSPREFEAEDNRYVDKARRLFSAKRRDHRP